MLGQFIYFSTYKSKLLKITFCYSNSKLKLNFISSNHFFLHVGWYQWILLLIMTELLTLCCSYFTDKTHELYYYWKTFSWNGFHVKLFCFNLIQNLTFLEKTVWKFCTRLSSVARRCWATPPSRTTWPWRSAATWPDSTRSHPSSQCVEKRWSKCRS